MLSELRKTLATLALSIVLFGRCAYSAEPWTKADIAWEAAYLTMIAANLTTR